MIFVQYSLLKIYAQDKKKKSVLPVERPESNNTDQFKTAGILDEWQLSYQKERKTEHGHPKIFIKKDFNV